jgi:putative ABC transport system substrate-binding protein
VDETLQATRFAAFRDEMRKQGYVEGRNLAIDMRWAAGDFDRLPALAADVVARKPEVVVTATLPAVRAAQRATSTIPIVMIAQNPVEAGVVASLARPGGNVTGVAVQEADLVQRKLDLLRAMVAKLDRVAILWDRAAQGADALKTVEHAAASMGMATRAFEANGPDEIRRAVAQAKTWGAQGLFQMSSPLATLHRKALAEALLAHRMPASCDLRGFVEAGCLMSYSIDLDHAFRTLARITARVLAGTKPAEIPVEQPRELDFVINARTAEALGLAIPSAVRIQLTDTIR